MTFKRAVAKAFHDEKSRVYLSLNTLISLTIVVSVITVIMETVPSFAAAHHVELFWLEVFFFTFFAVEYVLRVYSAPDKKKYIFSPLGIIDFICLLPGIALFGPPYNTFAVLWVFRLLRILRLLRTIRLIRFVTPSERMRSRLGRLLHKVQWLNVEIYLFAVALVVVFSATFMYLAEGHLPETHFPTIPDSMWWAIVTITTVGYGDLLPQTVAGKVIASFTMLAGMMLFALMLVVVGHVVQRLLFGSVVKK